MPEPKGFSKGGYGEAIAEGYLRAKGYEILATRYKCPYGEIDIVAGIGGVLVFAEVKLRRSTRSGYAAEAVTKTKQRFIINAALYYIGKKGDSYEGYRFDVIEIYGREFYDVNHIENAFYAE